MNRRLRGSLPFTAKSLEPSVPEGAKSQLQNRQKKQKNQYDKHTKSLPTLKSDDVVRHQTSTSWEPATIVQRHSTPRSYDLITARGNIIRRNRRHLKRTREIRPEVVVPVIDDIPESTNLFPQPPGLMPMLVNSLQKSVRTRSSRLVKPPVRYGDN